MDKSKRIPVSVDGDVFESYKALAVKQKRTTISVIREALGDWMGTVGAARMEAVEPLALRNLLTFPVPAVIDAPAVELIEAPGPQDLLNN